MSLGKKDNRILGDRYQLVELIGSGAMGQVYRAEDQVLGGVTVAVKFLSQTLLNEKMRHRFEREATISALLGEKSIHIIRVRDYGIDENEVPYYVMEFLEGQSLSDIIKFQPMALKRFLYITRQICVGMDAAHSGIMLHGELCQVVHRDIKPSNVSVMQDPTLGELVKILDFGIAKLVQANATQTHSFMGTLAYCSPEQMEGKELDNRSDIYSLGVMMYEMLTLEMPILPETSSFGAWYKAHHDFEPRPFESHLQIPSELKNIILKCMAKSRENRPQTVAEILKVIEGLEKKNSRGNSSNKTSYSGQETVVASSTMDNDRTEISDGVVKTSKPKINITKDTQLTWPKNKPLQKIVFPRIVNTQNETYPSLWVMLDKQDILNRIVSIRYNQFLFLNSPHPMILWITVIYNPTHGPRWLPCYLDLKTESARQVVVSLSELGSYKILFFALEEPEKCQHSMISTIASNQCAIMQEWIKNSTSFTDKGEAQISRKRLRDEFERLKPRILQKLAQSYK
ncbi:serine/threonine protein kinase [Geminocystis sp. NIES-3708]|uniref:serine/threonine protein kinase n=1 Tax=Geminocystis sp. NIES-3708 TaxID=1615909 RepID=UPI0005FC48F0|nr:serine/threonine-protein kinase [Geminocystis sp. NIES-3708]BAQ60852.1 serine/threonine protein kinase [Geminocystis sp. NIES-3708]